MTFRRRGGTLYFGIGDPNAIGAIQGSSTAGLSTTLSGVTAGNLIVLMIQTESSITSVGSVSISDTQSNTYNVISSSINHVGGVNGIFYYTVASSTGNITITGTQGSSFARMTAGEFKGITVPVDGYAVAFGTSTQTVNVSTIGNMIVGAAGSFHSASTYTAGSGYTILTQGSGSDASFIQYKISAATGSNTVNFTNSSGPDQAPFFAASFPINSNSKSVGYDGDFYIDTSSKKLWGPKTNGVYSILGTLT